MQEKTNKRNGIISAISIFLLAMAVIGASYAYLKARISSGGNSILNAGITDSSTLVLESNDINCVFDRDEVMKSTATTPATCDVSVSARTYASKTEGTNQCFKMTFQLYNIKDSVLAGIAHGYSVTGNSTIYNPTLESSTKTLWSNQSLASLYNGSKIVHIPNDGSSYDYLFSLPASSGQVSTYDFNFHFVYSDTMTTVSSEDALFTGRINIVKASCNRNYTYWISPSSPQSTGSSLGSRVYIRNDGVDNEKALCIYNNNEEKCLPYYALQNGLGPGGFIGLIAFYTPIGNISNAITKYIINSGFEINNANDELTIKDTTNGGGCSANQSSGEALCFGNRWLWNDNFSGTTYFTSSLPSNKYADYSSSNLGSTIYLRSDPTYSRNEACVTYNSHTFCWQFGREAVGLSDAISASGFNIAPNQCDITIENSTRVITCPFEENKYQIKAYNLGDVVITDVLNNKRCTAHFSTGSCESIS